jgi:osmoprotectant transport system ATP-binding protein
VTHDIDEAILLADRMAVLNVGGKLEQYGPPVDVLARPANDFVLEFLGADRGLKRLALIPVSAAELQRGPTVDVESTTANAREVMKREGVDWVAVLDHGRPRGWIAAAQLDGHHQISEIEPTRFPVAVKPADSLRHALDSLVSSPTQVVIVVDDGDRYLGLLDVGRIGKGLAT